MKSALFTPLVGYWISSFILALLLFFPMRRLILVIRVRRLEGRLKRQATEEEKALELKKAKTAAGLLAIVFSFLFNRAFYTF